MPKNPKTGEKRPADLNKLAAFIVGLATKEKPVGLLNNQPQSAPLKRRAAGIKGGEARASVLSPAKRKQIAKQGADARWKKS